MRTAVALALVSALGALAAAASGDGVAIATLGNGASIGFGLVRTGVAGPGGAIGEAALPRSNAVNRVLWDRETGAYFGYRIDVERRDGARPFRVSFRPLDRDPIETELRQRACPGCPPPAPLGSLPQFPPPQALAEGEALTLELLTNPTTGERIFDVVQLSARPLRTEAMHAAIQRAREGQLAISRAAGFVARSQFGAAIEAYGQALEVQPNDPSVHNKRGICFQRLRNDAMARREYERALELAPRYAEAWNNVGTLEQSRRRFKDAVRAYRKAIELKPSLATPWKNLGNAYLALEQVPEALEAFQEAFRLDPTILGSESVAVPAVGVDVAKQNFLLAKLLAQNGQLDAALDFLRRAREAGFQDFARVEADPAFRGVLADPRYREIAGKR